MDNANIIKTVIGPTDKIKFEDIAVVALGHRKLLDNCGCGEQLTNIIAVQSPLDAKPGQPRLRAIKCYECGAIWIDEHNEED